MRALRWNIDVVLVLAALAVAAAWGLRSFYWTDYDAEAFPAMHALLGGDVRGFLALSPVYGGSLVLRAPLVLATGALGGGDLAAFRVGSLAFLAVPAGLALALAAGLRAAGRPLLWRALAIALVAANPVLVKALVMGHPEDVLAAGACVAAVLAAQHDRPLATGLLLGLAIAGKQWAVLAVPVALLALPARRPRMLACALGLAALAYLPLLVADAGHVLAANRAVARSGGMFYPQQVWWVLGHPAGPYGIRAAPAFVERGARYALLAAALLLCVAHRSRRRGGVGEEALLLLAAVMLLRCLMDPWDNVYYALPFLLALTAWEVRTRPGPPVLGLAATAAVWLCFVVLPPLVGRDALALAYLAWALPAFALLAARLLRTQSFWIGEDPCDSKASTTSPPSPPTLRATSTSTLAS